MFSSAQNMATLVRALPLEPVFLRVPGTYVLQNDQLPHVLEIWKYPAGNRLV
jgi:hypothetical protein